LADEISFGFCNSFTKLHPGVGGHSNKYPSCAKPRPLPAIHMTHQLSNKQTQLAQVLLTLFGLGLPSFILSFFIFGSDNLNVIVRLIIAVLSVIGGLSILYFSAHLHKVTFDRDFIYLSRLGKKEKISIDQIDEVKPSFIPFRLFYSNAYIITVVYFDNQKKCKAKFLSKGATGLLGTVDHIPLLDTVRQFIRHKKYSR